jgi:hypothetical protein
MGGGVRLPLARRLLSKISRYRLIALIPIKRCDAARHCHPPRAPGPPAWPTAKAALERFEALGIATESTGRHRDRLYAYKQPRAILDRGTS